MQGDLDLPHSKLAHESCASPISCGRVSLTESETEPEAVQPSGVSSLHESEGVSHCVCCFKVKAPQVAPGAGAALGLPSWPAASGRRHS